MNPTDAFRKEQRKKEIKKNKNDRKKVSSDFVLHSAVLFAILCLNENKFYAADP